MITNLGLFIEDMVLNAKLRSSANFTDDSIMYLSQSEYLI